MCAKRANPNAGAAVLPISASTSQKRLHLHELTPQVLYCLFEPPSLQALRVRLMRDLISATTPRSRLSAGSMSIGPIRFSACSNKVPVGRFRVSRAYRSSSSRSSRSTPAGSSSCLIPESTSASHFRYPASTGRAEKKLSSSLSAVSRATAFCWEFSVIWLRPRSGSAGV